MTWDVVSGKTYATAAEVLVGVLAGATMLRIVVSLSSRTGAELPYASHLPTRTDAALLDTARRQSKPDPQAP